MTSPYDYVILITCFHLYFNPIFYPLFSQPPYFHPHSPFLLFATLLQYAIYLVTLYVLPYVTHSLWLIWYVETFQFIKPVQSAFFEWPFSSPPNQSLNWMLPFRLYFLSPPANQMMAFFRWRGKTSRFSTKFVKFFYVQLCTFTDFGHSPLGFSFYKTDWAFEV